MNITEAVARLTESGYYSKPCQCGANPAWHLGHTQQCADEHVAAL